MRKTYPIFIFLLSCFIGNAQVIEWQNTIGGTGDDGANSVQQTSDGGYIIGGQSLSGISGDKTEDNLGGDDYWIIKTDGQGSIQWQNTIGGDDIDNLFSICQTPDGGYMIGGYSFSDSSGDKTENSNGGYDFWILKLDPAGAILWQNTIGGSGSDVFRSLEPTSDGGFILGGHSSSNISGDKTENSNGAFDYWIVKIDSIGSIQWQNTIGGSGTENISTVRQTSDGGYIIGGQSNSNISGDKNEDAVGGIDYWIVKIDSIGNIQWQNTIGGSITDNLYSASQDNDGSYIIGGYSNSGISGDKTAGNYNGSFDYWIVKLDSSGNLVWDRVIGGQAAEYLTDVDITSDHGYLLSGYSNSALTWDKTETTNGGQDFWIVKIDSAGNIQWQNTIGGTDHDKIYCASATMDGSYILSGTSLSGISYDKFEGNIGGEDIWVMKITSSYNDITGRLFIDLNNNLTLDTSDVLLPNKKVVETNSGRYCLSDCQGYYQSSILDSGSYIVAPGFTVDYYSPVPINHSGHFNGINETDSLKDFAFQASGNHSDLSIKIYPVSGFRPGFFCYYMINIQNVGTTTTTSDTITFFPDSNLTYNNASVPPYSTSPDSVTWILGGLDPYQHDSIMILVIESTTVPSGTLIVSTASVDPTIGDENTADNIDTAYIHSTGSFDPNEILVDREEIYSYELSNPPYLEYTIFFQNTGNDTAFNIRIVNPFDTAMLDPSSFQFVASSHPVTINFFEWQSNFEFSFPNIMLPDSNVNEMYSHGFIRYRVKLRNTIIAGDTIRNTSYIYFDFNSPVQTNIAKTAIVLYDYTAAKTFERDVILVPNPAYGKLTVDSKKYTIKRISVYNMLGENILILDQANDSKVQKVNLDVSEFRPGVYFVSIETEKGIVTQKFIRQ